MPFEIKQPDAPKKTFILNRALHLTADEKVVEEGDPAGVKVLAGAGAALYEEEAKHYGLDDSYRAKEGEEAGVSGIGGPEEKSEEPAADQPKGKLPADFPGHDALAAAEPPVNTYHQLRKHVADGTLTDIPGIGKATAQKIEEALSQAPDEKE